MTSERVHRILLVDGEPEWSQAAKRALREQGKYRVESATDIEIALNSAYTHDFELILISAILALGEDTSEFEEMVRVYPDKVLVISDVHSIATAIGVLKVGAAYAEKAARTKLSG